MKPDWKDAPEWAQWLAMDGSGLWCLFECRPTLELGVWTMGGKHSFANFEPSVEARPK